MRVFVVTPFLATACAAEPFLVVEHDPEDIHDHEELAPLTPDDVRATFTADGDWLVSPILETSGGATRVSVALELAASSGAVTIEARGVGADAGESAWAGVAPGFVEESLVNAFLDIPASPAAQVRVREADLAVLVSLRWSATRADGDATVAEPLTDSEDDGLVGYAAPAIPGVTIVQRSGWSPHRARGCGTDSRRRSMLTIHHTVTPNRDTVSARARIKGMQWGHLNERDFCDIGYHFLIDREGTIYEGRPMHQVGNHSRNGYNAGNIGIALIGCFGEARSCSSVGGTASPPEAMVRSAARLVAGLAQHFGIRQSRDRIRGQNEWPGNQKDCPGRSVLARMDEIALGGVVENAGGSDDGGGRDNGGGGASCTHTLGGRYADRACSASYQCCDGRWSTRANGCGSCACVEESGENGC